MALVLGPVEEVTFAAAAVAATKVTVVAAELAPEDAGLADVAAVAVEQGQDPVSLAGQPKLVDQEVVVACKDGRFPFPLTPMLNCTGWTDQPAVTVDRVGGVMSYARKNNKTGILV